MTDGEADGTALTGPPEPVVREGDDGERTVEIITPTGEPGAAGTPFNTVQLGTWECQRCGNIEPMHDLNGANPMQPPNECAGCERKGVWTHAGGISDEFAQVASRASKIWHPPSGVEDGDFEALWDDVEQYIRDHWDADEDEIYAGLTAYALSTWLRPNLTFVPHLMLMGHTTGGKTRLLNTLARVSYRAVVSASATPASMFRMVDAYNVSFFVSEYHGLDQDAQRELDNVIRAGQKRGEVVTRAEKTQHGHEPQAYDPFTHIAVASQYTPDDDIVNRCIQVHSSPTNRDMPATHDEDRAQELRNRLLYARFRLLDDDEWAECEQAAYDYMHEHGIKDRPREKLLSLITVAIRWARLDDRFNDFIKMVRRQDREAAANSEDALVVEAIRDLAFEEIASQAFIGDGDPFQALEISYSEIAQQYESVTGIERSSSWVGHVRNRLGLKSERKRDGTVVKDEELRTKLQELCENHHLEWERLEGSDDGDDPRKIVEDHVLSAYDVDDEFTPSMVAGQLIHEDISPEKAAHIMTEMAKRGDLVRDDDIFWKP